MKSPIDSFMDTHLFCADIGPDGEDTGMEKLALDFKAVTWIEETGEAIKMWYIPKAGKL